ncbi:uncharacterized protein N7511_003881 [Penicillium nucicola]|uniref:uncharacterized protein n=1 Tax=Penicillium nucicola TaxID=1850975 RepID=UPI0025450A63|nr:uncharacterized protein N7511_003881 [Penicillium nucicola]KAJ5766265.1 hypothetical protein N7511_003881 [Penicillium nucicola]
MPRFNTQAHLDKCVACTGMHRSCFWSKDSNGEALPRCHDSTDRNRKCDPMPLTYHILSLYLDALTDTSPATHAALTTGPRFEFLRAVEDNSRAESLKEKNDTRDQK